MPVDSTITTSMTRQSERIGPISNTGGPKAKG